MRNQFVIILVYSILLLSVEAQQSGKAPQINLSQNIFDWGVTELPSDGKLNSTIEIRNTGNDTLRIYEIQTDCGCTVISLDNHSIPPDSMEVLKVEINVSIGKIEKTVTILSNDPRSPNAFLMFIAEINSLPNIR